MKHTTTIALAVLVMAATGCETAKQKEARGLERTPYGDWIPKGTSYFGDGRPSKRRVPYLEQGRTASGGGSDIGPIPNLIPTPVIEPFPRRQAPVVVTGNAPMTTISTDPDGDTTVVNYGFPDYRPPIAPYPYYGY